MGRSRYKIYEEEFPYFISSSINSGLPIFGIPNAAKIVLNSLEFLRTERDIKVIAYVIMEDHIHAILKGKDLAVKLGRFKSFTAHEIIALLQQLRRKRILAQLKWTKATHKKDQYISFGKKDFILSRLLIMR